MKTLLYFLLAASTLLWGEKEPTSGVTVTVTLENVLNDQGEILAALHTADTFMKGKGIQGFEAKAQKGAITFTFEDVAPGTYAISVLHDMNSNQRMDYGPGGMPEEPYAISGSDMSMGPPSFDSSKFEVGPEDLELRLRF